MKNRYKELLFKLLPLEKFIKLKYKRIHGNKLDLDNPKKLSEKIFWLKLYNGEYLLDKIQRVYDKYNARAYIEEKLGEGFLPKLYGVYDSVDEIPFDDLPDEYVIKITQSSGYNIIKNKQQTMTNDEIREQLRVWLNTINDLKHLGETYFEESYYYTGKAKIICEEYLYDGKNPTVDIDFLCFNGEPKLVEFYYGYIGEDNQVQHDAYKNVYTLDGKLVPINLGRSYSEEYSFVKPLNFDLMIEVARKLSQDFPYVRVDLYNINGRIVVGELTWIPMGCSSKFTPENQDLKLGLWLKLPNKKLNFKKLKSYIMRRYF